jgi:ABC-type oligopeptide transport system ATPase subunit
LTIPALSTVGIVGPTGSGKTTLVDIILGLHKVKDGTIKIDKQPYIGSLFKSQNASTWEPDQNKDLKFVIRRAVFEASGTAQFDIIEPEDLKQYQTLFVSANSISPVGTSISWDAKAWYGGSVYDNDWVAVDVNQDINYQTLKSVAARDTSVTYPALRLRATMSTTDNAVSPAVDAQSISTLLALNTINNNASGEAGVKRGGTADARYITKVINLNSGFEATNLNVTFDAYKPAGTDIKVYYKTLPFEKTTPIEEETWVEMIIENGISIINSVNSLDFKEHRFFPSGAVVNFVPQNNPIAARFNAFQIKIVLTSSNVALSPRIRDLRIIALDS